MIYETLVPVLEVSNFYSINLIEGWAQISGETRLCVLSEMQRSGPGLSPKAIRLIVPELNELETFATEIVRMLEGVSHPWAKNHIGANLGVRMYQGYEVCKGDVWGAIHNYKTCCLPEGLTLNPLKYKNGTFVCIRHDGSAHFTVNNGWNPYVGIVREMPEVEALTAVWEQWQPQLGDLCTRFLTRKFEEDGR